MNGLRLQSTLQFNLERKGLISSSMVAHITNICTSATNLYVRILLSVLPSTN